MIPSPEMVILLSVLGGKRYRYTDEVMLHDGLSEAMRAAGIDPEREVRVMGGRIDFVVGAIGVEVKVKGSTASLARQVERYADDPRLDEFLIVTTRPAHARLPNLIGGKPVWVHFIGGLSL